MAGVIGPPPLQQGARVAVVAPSSPFGREEFLAGLAWLRARYQLVVRSSILSRAGYLAGDDERRADELARAMLRDDVAAIVCARGGYGATRIAERLPWQAFAARPKWIVGFSDITALHLEAARVGVRSVHGPHVTGLGKPDPWTRACWIRALEHPEKSFEWSSLRVLRGGRARGKIVGGNLALVEAMAASGRLVIPEGAVVALEDVTERPYRIDRMLTALVTGGYFSRASAIVLGSFTQCTPGPDGVTVDAVLEDRLGGLGVPVLAGAPFGHGADNEAFVLGRDVEIDGAVIRFV